MTPICIIRNGCRSRDAWTNEEWISVDVVHVYGSVLVSWCAKNRHILTAPEEL